MSSSHEDHPDLPPPWVSEVAEGVFAYIQPDGSWWINNTGFIAARPHGPLDRHLLDRAANSRLPGEDRRDRRPGAPDAGEHPPPR